MKSSKKASPVFQSRESETDLLTEFCGDEHPKNEKQGPDKKARKDIAYVVDAKVRTTNADKARESKEEA